MLRWQILLCWSKWIDFYISLSQEFTLYLFQYYILILCTTKKKSQKLSMRVVPCRILMSAALIRNIRGIFCFIFKIQMFYMNIKKEKFRIKDGNCFSLRTLRACLVEAKLCRSYLTIRCSSILSASILVCLSTRISNKSIVCK